MKKLNSPECIAILAEGLSVEELPLSRRSDRWWDMFWHYVAKYEAKRLKEKSL